MKLLVDVGNSRIKWRLLERPHDQQQALPHSGRDFPALLASAWQALPRREISEIWVGCVAGPDMEQALRIYVKQHWESAKVIFVRAESRAGGVHNAYPRAETLGVDRWLALIAAHHLGIAPCAIADCGSALTLDALDDGGRHLGGLILPGEDILRRSLSQHIHALRGLDDQEVSGGESNLGLFNSDTLGGVRMGIRFAAIALIERFMKELEQHLDRSPQLLITGGEAPRLLPGLGMSCRHVPDLVLQGLAVLAGKNTCV